MPKAPRPFVKRATELCLMHPQRYSGRGRPPKAFRDAGFTTCMFDQLTSMHRRTKLKLVREAKAIMTDLNKIEDEEISDEAYRATNTQNLRDQKTPFTRFSQTSSQSASSMTVTIPPEDMGGGTERKKRYPKGFRLTPHQKILRAAIEVREKRRKSFGYHEATKIEK